MRRLRRCRSIGASHPTGIGIQMCSWFCWIVEEFSLLRFPPGFPDGRLLKIGEGPVSDEFLRTGAAEHLIEPVGNLGLGQGCWRRQLNCDDLVFGVGLECVHTNFLLSQLDCAYPDGYLRGQWMLESDVLAEAQSIFHGLPCRVLQCTVWQVKVGIRGDLHSYPDGGFDGFQFGFLFALCFFSFCLQDRNSPRSRLHTKLVGLTGDSLRLSRNSGNTGRTGSPFFRTFLQSWQRKAPLCTTELLSLVSPYFDR